MGRLGLRSAREGVMHMRARCAGVVGVVVLTFLLALPGVAAAAADYRAEGAEMQYYWYGVTCQIYSYDWTPPLPELGPEKHVSSIYADGNWETTTRNYIELGLEQLVTWGLPKQFMAYENYPRTDGQVKIRYGTQGAGTWAYCEVNNHEIGGSDWYAAINGTTVLRGYELVNPSGGLTKQAHLRGDAERWGEVPDDNRHSCKALRKKDSKGNWYDWSTLQVGSDDPEWEAVIGTPTWWYTRRW